MAVRNACAIDTTGSNTGVECGKNLQAPKGFVLVRRTDEWDDDDLEDFYNYIQTKLHAAAAQRWFIINADLKNIENNEEADTMETFADGSQVFIKYGNYNRTASFYGGGTCLAKALMSFNRKGFSFIEFDNAGQIAMKKKANGKYAGFQPDELYSPKPTLANFANSYQNKMFISIKPDEYIKKSAIFAIDEDLTDLMGLLDVEMLEKAAGTATKLTVGAQTECAETDLFDLLPDALNVIPAWKVTNKATGATITVTAVAKNATLKAWELTGVFTAGQTFIATLVPPASLAALTIPVTGYEAVLPVEIAIPA